MLTWIHHLHVMRAAALLQCPSVGAKRARRTLAGCPGNELATLGRPLLLQERDNMGPGDTYLNAPDDLLHSLEGPGIDLRW